MPDQTVMFVNVIDVEPFRQPELIEILSEGMGSVIQHRPGFVSGSILASTDGNRVVGRAQWRSAVEASAIRTDPAAEFIGRIASIAQASPNVVRLIHEYGA